MKSEDGYTNTNNRATTNIVVSAAYVVSMKNMLSSKDNKEVDKELQKIQNQRLTLKLKKGYTASKGCAR